MYDSRMAFVAQITLVKGVPFYGFYVGYKFFLKVYMFNPLNMTRLADLLRQGTIMKKFIQPYESHMQYLAQWMCDYNLYGCSYIDCKLVKFRSPVPVDDEDATIHRWHNGTIPTSLVSDEAQLPRQSHCSLEVDVCVHNILNRIEITARPLHHDFVEYKHPSDSDIKLVASMAGLWRDETRRRKVRLGESGSSPFPTDVLVPVSADPRNSQPGGWIHEEEYAKKIIDIMRAEQIDDNGKKVTFDSFIKNPPFEAQVKTTLESVDDLFPENVAKIKAVERVTQTNVNPDISSENGEADVDKVRLMSFVEHDSPYESDEELARKMLTSQEIQEAQFDEEDESVDVINTNSGPNCIIKTSGEKSARPSDGSENCKSLDGIHGPASCAELEVMGIRNVGDYSYVEDDSFNIPLDCTGSVKSLRKDLVNGDLGRQETAPSPKRRKISKINRSSRINRSSKKDSFERYQAAQGELRPILSDVIPDIGFDSLHVAPLTDANAAVIQLETKENEHLSGSASQKSCVTNTTTSNGVLSFPIVKGRQESTRALRIDRGSKSPMESSPYNRTKSASFGTSFPKSPAISLHSEKLSRHISTPPAFHSSQVLQAFSKIYEAFDIPNSTAIMCFSQGPPEAVEIVFEMRQAQIPSIIYQDAYYSDEKDVPERPRGYAGKEFRIESVTMPYLPDFDLTGTSLASRGERTTVVIDRAAEDRAYHQQAAACNLRIWEIDEPPPTRLEVQSWLEEMNGSQQIMTSNLFPTNETLSQIDPTTQKNQHGFKYSQKQRTASVRHEVQYMSTMSLEIFANTREDLVPNPEQDGIGCIFWCIRSDNEDFEVDGTRKGSHVGLLAISEDGNLGNRISRQIGIAVESESNELDLFNRLVDIVRSYDPDILTGYEVHGGSWGYVIERARLKYDYNLSEEFSRTKLDSRSRLGKQSDKWGFNQTSSIQVTGRHMINIWRAMRGELNLLQYTMENVVFHLLHRRIPHYSYKTLTSWYNSPRTTDLAKVIEYFISRVQLDLEILDQNELIPRTSEQARLLGVDFFSVFSRGSQFKVESLMFRIAKPESFLLPSPSRKQVGQQNALECLPLVMEPQSAFYNSPLLVLDFQSLYPSVMIAYNYCYSTFLGRVVHWRGQNKMGFTDYQRQIRLLELFKDQINIAPNGIMYAKPGIRKSLLAKMLGEILETRVMVKSGMREDKEDKTLQRLLNNRQLALKLIANVTYGYTSASFSGRMPCSEIADSIVQTGRETLEKAIALIHSVGKWGAEVVYGDTDSLFVSLKGRTKDEAFDIGEDIAKTITNLNPRPVRLKFEKVYFPCVLIAKKRYVGFKYENKSQTEPEFDAKGIETVRRDGTPAEQRIEEKALKILFRTADLSQVKKYFQKQCTKIMKGKVSIQDFCFAKEVKLGTYSDKGVPPPGALISTKRMLKDPRAEPQYGERIPYIVIAGAPGARLIDRCVSPDFLLNDDQNELDAEYYITKNLIPPLERIFNLMGANVRQWYDEMPKFQRIRRVETGSMSGNDEMSVLKKTLESYMKSSTCLVCHDKLEEKLPICSKCMQNTHSTIYKLRLQLNQAEQKASNIQRVCRSCSRLVWGEKVCCDSKDCPVFYTRMKHTANSRNTRLIIEPVIDILEDIEVESLEW